LNKNQEVFEWSICIYWLLCNL